MDVAVTAKRLGANSVTMISLETEDSLPATPEEMERALEEGIRHKGGWGPKEVSEKAARLRGLHSRSVPVSEKNRADFRRSMMKMIL